MNNLFNDNRIVKLLLLFHKSPAWNLSLLAEKLDVSERTVRNDIKYMEKELDGCAVAVNEQGRYVLHIYDKKRFHQIVDKLLKADDFLNSSAGRMDYLFIRLMRAGESLLTDDLAYEIHVGRTTLVNDLKKLRERLFPYQLTIVGKTSKGIALCGLEAHIRQYILENNYQRIYSDYPLDDEVMDIIDTAFKKHALDKKTQDNFRRFMTIMLDRFLTGHCIGKLPDMYYKLVARSEFELIDRMLTEMYELYQIEFPVEEKIFVMLPIIAMRTPTDTANLDNIMLDGRIQPLLQKITQRIEYELGISMQSNDLSQEFMYHLMFMLNRLRFNVKIQHPFLDDLRSKYSLAWHMAVIAANTVHEEMQLTVSKDEIGYLAIYFSVFVEEYGEKQNKPIRIAVVCGTGRSTTRLIETQLKKILDSTTEMELFTADKVKVELLNNYDIILSTIDMPYTVKQPVIHIREIFNEQELKRKIDKAKYGRQAEAPVWDNNCLLASMLNVNRFFLLQNVEKYEDALLYMVHSLHANGMVDDGFEVRLKRREQESSTIFDGGVAIPHTIQTASGKLVMAIGILKEPIYQQGQKVQIIFMLALPEQLDSNDELLLRVYDEIIAITGNEELCAQIAAAESFADLLRVLYSQNSIK